MAKQKIHIDGKEIAIIQANDQDYISLTDMVGRGEEGTEIIRNWMRSRLTIDFLFEWESLYNDKFNLVTGHQIRNQSSIEDITFTISVKKWITETGAVGIQSKPGRYGGTYAHKDIAFEFGTRISARFKLLLIRDYQRLKDEEAARINSGWTYRRFLSKVNYRLHTDTIKDVILPALQTPKNREWIIYAEEADLLNMAVFGMTAKQWREQNPELATKGNIRDFADVTSLTILANIEAMNAFYIDKGINKEKRFELLREAAIGSYSRLIAREENMGRLY